MEDKRTSKERHSRLMRRMVETFNTGDVSTLESLVSPNYVDHQGIGGSEVYGPDGFANVVMLARRSHPGLRVVIQELTVAGDTVQAQLVWFEPEPTWSPSPETAQEMQRRTAETVRFADGLAVEHWGKRLH